MYLSAPQHTRETPLLGGNEHDGRATRGESFAAQRRLFERHLLHVDNGRHHNDGQIVPMVASGPMRSSNKSLVPNKAPPPRWSTA